MRIPFMKHITWYLVLIMGLLAVAPKVDAGFSPSDLAALTSVDRHADLEKIRQVLEMKVVRERMEKLGFTQDEIAGKLEQLDDQQIHQLALKIDDLQVGGDALGVVIAILVIVILVILIIQLSGHRIIVK